MIEICERGEEQPTSACAKGENEKGGWGGLTLECRGLPS